ncbi:hypothetical protein GCM10010387_22020 [Streptomyces inusitatus]|uniref:Uncharacterized protein n=1 Tax=Streptomyces inusitatus TaxID=68221 RepID=A0A918PZI9_9ACTN|nr:hypothetical protein [Streptomyces inusitatus]GGZ28194.1 hypothetical protein GCM10010387_22020 [Streptomyces inusitatus]
MRTTARLLTTAVLAVSTIGLGAPGAFAEDHASLEVFPSTAAPGASLTLNTTACGPGGEGVGDARALGAGEFRLSPGAHKESAVGQLRVPYGVQPGVYGVSVRCDNGKRVTGEVTLRRHQDESGSLNGKNEGESESREGGGDQGRSQGQGHDSGGQDSGGHDPGGYESGGQGGHHQQPSGHVQTGVGGSIGPDTAQVAAGAAVLAAAAAGGTLLLRRRASGTQGG